MSFDALPQTVSEYGVLLPQEDLSHDGWRIENPESIQLLKKLQKKGTPLGDYLEGRFYRGIITGLNEAFVIDDDTHKKLIREDKKSADLIKPYLRGRDVKRWTVHPQNLYLIAFPFGFNEKLEEYPAILEHLTQYKTKLKNRGQCKTSQFH